MNEQIQELRKQACQWVVDNHQRADPKNLSQAEIEQRYLMYEEKFALLIVRECMDIAKRTGENFGSANSDVLEGGRGGAFCVYQNIKNTFEVEE